MFRTVVAFACIVQVFSLSTEEAWPCKPVACPGPTPTSVHKLRPCDVRYVMAMGDSITAAAVAKPLNKGPYEFRGLSYAIGEDKNVTTIPNILKHYSPSIKGGSVGAHIPEMHGWPHEALWDRLNGAQSGAVVQDLPGKTGGAQIDYLLREMKRIGVKKEEWKVMTIWIGANNLCGICESMHNATSNPTAFEKELDLVLGRLQKEFPRTFVNLMSFFNLSQVYTTDLPHLYCDAVHSLVTECVCMWKKHDGAKMRKMMDIGSQQYNQVMRKLAKKYNNPNNHDFAVVFQPFLERSKIPNEKFLSPVDCFHPSAEAHAHLASLLWNSMITPMAQKPTKVSLTTPLKCATESSLLYTS